MKAAVGHAILAAFDRKASALIAAVLDTVMPLAPSRISGVVYSRHRIIPVP